MKRARSPSTSTTEDHEDLFVHEPGCDCHSALLEFCFDTQSPMPKVQKLDNGVQVWIPHKLDMEAWILKRMLINKEIAFNQFSVFLGCVIRVLTPFFMVDYAKTIPYMKYCMDEFIPETFWREYISTDMLHPYFAMEKFDVVDLTIDDSHCLVMNHTMKHDHNREFFKRMGYEYSRKPNMDIRASSGVINFMIALDEDEDEIIKLHL